MDKKYRLTTQTLAAMEQELQYLQTIRWREIEEMVEEAKLYGDLSENWEYSAARTEQEKCLRRISEIEHILSHAVVTGADGQEYVYHFSGRREVEEEPIPTSGKCGESLFWELRDETLHIFGTGPMENYGSRDLQPELKPAPWHGLTERFRYIVIEEGVTTIGSHAFEYVEVEDITIPDSVKVIESRAFFSALVDRLELRDTLETVKPNSFSGDPSTDPRDIGTLVLSANIPHIEREAFVTELLAPKELVLTGTLPEDLMYLVYSHLFVFLADRIRYPGEWDTDKETFYEKLSRTISDVGTGIYDDLLEYTEKDFAELKTRLIPME